MDLNEDRAMADRAMTDTSPSTATRSVKIDDRLEDFARRDITLN
jgi:hypothetical protein